MTIIMTGVAEFQKALDGLVAGASAAGRKAVTTGGHLLEAQVKQILTESHSTSNPGGRDSHGRFVKNQHSASPPGQPPALVTGTLRRSIKVTPPSPKGPTGWEISVGPSAIYGRIQELGGITGAYGSYLPPRPYMAPALKRVIDDGSLAACYATAWREAF